MSLMGCGVGGERKARFQRAIGERTSALGAWRGEPVQACRGFLGVGRSWEKARRVSGGR